MKDVRISPVAQAQLDEIHAYTAHRWGPAQAVEYSKSLIATLQDIARDAAHSRPINAAIGVQGYFCQSGSHYIYWQSRPGAVFVVAVLHCSMDQSSRLSAAVNEP